MLVKNSRILLLTFDTSFNGVKKKINADIRVAIPQNKSNQDKASKLNMLSISVIPVNNIPQQMDAERNELRQQSPFILYIKAINTQHKIGNKINIIIDTICMGFYIFTNVNYKSALVAYLKVLSHISLRTYNQK